jgi:bifunctional non-homologous end joining protein LigD
VASSLPPKLTPQLATLVPSPPKAGGWIYEVKFDGYRILARCDHGNVRLFTRNANDWTGKMQSLADEVARLPIRSGWFDGEVVVLNDAGVPDFNALQNAFDEVRTESIVYFVFDVLHLNGEDMRNRPFEDRRATLESLFVDFQSDRVRLSQTFDADGASVLKSACAMGLEGVIAKRVSAPYRSARTDTWLKLKCQLRQEFVIGGFTPRMNAPRQIGSLLLGVYAEDGRLRFAGSVGTGWSSRDAESILSTLIKLEADRSPFDAAFAPKRGRWSRRAAGSERWVKPTAVAEVSFGEWTPDGHIRHASFKGMRKDKPARSIRRES